jgi:hypothetical protein
VALIKRAKRSSEVGILNDEWMNERRVRGILKEEGLCYAAWDASGVVTTHGSAPSLLLHRELLSHTCFTVISTADSHLLHRRNAILDCYP